MRFARPAGGGWPPSVRVPAPCAPRSAHFPLRTVLLLFVICHLSFTPGCAAPRGPIFDPPDPPIVWPPPPDEPRIRYIGELTGEASLGVRPKGWAAVRAVIAGPQPTGRFVAPTAVAVAGSKVFVADRGTKPVAGVHVLDLDARRYAFITDAGGEPLGWPIDVAIAGSLVAVADAQRSCVELFEPSGRHVRTIRDGLKRPASLAFDPQTQSLYVLDSAAHGVAVFTLDGTPRGRFGSRGLEPGRFNYPTALTLADFGGFRRLVVADAMNFRVQILEPDGSPLRVFGQKGDAAGDFALPRDVAVDSAGHIYVLDNQFENVQIFDAAGRLLMAFGREGHAPGEFWLPSGITIDATDRIWIADTYNRRVQVFERIPEPATKSETVSHGAG